MRRLLFLLLFLFGPGAIYILILRQGIDYSQFPEGGELITNQEPTERDLQYLGFWERWFGVNDRFMEAELERRQAEEEYEAVRARGYR